MQINFYSSIFNWITDGGAVGFVGIVTAVVGSVANSSQGNTRKAIRAPELTVSAFFLFCRQGVGEGKEKGHRLNQPERQKETKKISERNSNGRRRWFIELSSSSAQRNSSQNGSKIPWFAGQSRSSEPSAQSRDPSHLHLFGKQRLSFSHLERISKNN